LEKDTGYRG